VYYMSSSMISNNWNTNTCLPDMWRI